MIKRIKSFFKKKEPKTKLWRNVAGHNIYYWENIGEVPTSRKVKATVALESAGFGIRPTDVPLLCDSILEQQLELMTAVSNKDINDSIRINTNIVSLLGHVKTQSENFFPRRLIAQVGSHAILVDDEKENQSTVHHNNIKEKLLEDDEVYSFFLAATLKFVALLREDIKKSSIEKYSNPQSRFQQREIFRLIGLKEFERSLNDTTNA